MGWEHEFIVMENSLRSKRDRTNGFEGCSNKDCNFGGFYQYRYSVEGLCTICELEQFPDRFYGCMFCRQPQKYEGACLTCNADFQKWLVSIFDCEGISWLDGLHSIEMNIHCLVKDHKVMLPSRNRLVPFFPRDPKGFLRNEWKGLYAGNNEWVIPVLPKIKPTDEMRLWCNPKAIHDYLLSQGINIYADVQYVPKNDNNV